jgi:hypothetical protein
LPESRQGLILGRRPEREVPSMTEMIARCGFKCHACLAYKGINKTPEDQAEAARAW